MSIGKKFILIAILFAIAGMFLGVFMGINDDFTLVPMHAHINLIGWVSLGLLGLVYSVFPDMGKSKIGKVHFYVATIGAFLQSLGLYIVITTENKSVVIVGALLTISSMIMFFVNVLKNAKEKAS